MLARFTLLFAFVIPALSLAAAEPPVGRERIDRLITQLGHRQFAERDAATRTLDALGEPALEALRKARTSEDAEISRRAEELVAVIERRLENARLLAPRRVRLVYKNANVLDVLADVTRKTGFPVEFEGNRAQVSQRTLTLDTGEVTVWEALDQFLLAAGLSERLTPAAAKNSGNNLEIQNGVIIQGRVNLNTIYLDGRPTTDPRLVVGDGKQPRWPTHDAGAVRVRAVPAASAGNGTPNGGGGMLLNLEVTPQPQMVWQGVLDVRVQRAVDEHGQELAPAVTTTTLANTSNLLWARNGAIFVADMDVLEPALATRFHAIRLTGGRKVAQTLREVHGIVAAQTEVGPEPLLTVDNVFQATGRTLLAADGAALKVLGTTRDTRGKIKVRVELQTPLTTVGGGIIVRNGRRGGVNRVINTREAEMSGVPLTLYDAAGQRIALEPIEATQQVMNGFGFAQELVLTYEPKPGQAEAARLVYTGKRPVVLDIPFTLKNVAVP